MQHSALTAERWARFTFAQQILSIAAEMLRANSALIPERRAALCNGYERVLRLVDLSIECTDRRGRRRELLLWRDVVAQLYIASAANPEVHAAALRALLYFTPESAKQIPFVTLSR